MNTAPRFFLLSSLAALLAIAFAACGGGGSEASTADASAPMRTGYLDNPAPYIPSQCYTKTEDDQGGVHNPCYACHVTSVAPNYINDAAVQLTYKFPTPALTNRWSNLFKDRSQAFARLGDEEILAYVRQSNYFDSSGGIKLGASLKTVPKAWDADNNGKWDGYVPDLYLNFDDDGFDHDRQGNYTAWRAFAYYPFLGTFWPTNGSTDDVMIRLAPAFRQDEAGAFDLTVYKINLAIVEALILRHDVTIDATDETRLKVDLDKNGSLGTATQVTFDWAPTSGRDMSYVGLARQQQVVGSVHLAAGLFPEGTEFIHSVRYLDTDAAGNISMAARMKELRYAIKKSWYSYSALNMQATAEAKEKIQFPERPRQITGSAEIGLANGQGWTFQSFIEDAQGELRPQTYEENVFCIGCHSGIGATTDANFSFPRKLGATASKRGWYHWSRQSPAGLKEPLRADGQGEYAYYLAKNGAGDELRENEEVRSKFFNADGTLKSDALAKLKNDIGYLLFPSRERAIALNKGYRVIVQEQSYIKGRDAAVKPAVNVHASVSEDQPTGITTAIGP
jgi:hypothetical protein